MTWLLMMVLAQLGSDPTSPFREGMDRKEAVKITNNIYEAIGFGNTFLITTSEGNVIIDTSNAQAAQLHVKLLKARGAAPVKYIILTHGHGDHTGGVGLWKEPGTQVIAQKNQVEFLNYQARLNRFFALRNAAQFVYPHPAEMKWPGDEGAKQMATILLVLIYLTHLTLVSTQKELGHLFIPLEYLRKARSYHPVQ